MSDPIKEFNKYDFKVLRLSKHLTKFIKPGSEKISELLIILNVAFWLIFYASRPELLTTGLRWNTLDYVWPITLVLLLVALCLGYKNIIFFGTKKAGVIAISSVVSLFIGSNFLKKIVLRINDVPGAGIIGLSSELFVTTIIWSITTYGIIFALYINLQRPREKQSIGVELMCYLSLIMSILTIMIILPLWALVFFY